MSMEYIRFTYSVPAKRGARVEYTGDGFPKQGKITGAKGSYIRVRLDGEKLSKCYHPRWEMKYFAPPASPRAGSATE